MVTISTAACASATAPSATPQVSRSAGLGTQGKPVNTGPPGVRNVAVVTAGIGAYLETVLPVAIIKNESTTESAQNLTITWTVRNSRGATFGRVAGSIAILGAGQTTVVGARMAGQDVGGTAAATVATGAWTTDVSAVITATPGGLNCAGCGPYAGDGTVTSTLTSDTPSPPTPLNVGAACIGANGAIDGGGSTVFFWSATGTSQATSIPVLINGSPRACIVGATPAS